MTYKTILLAYDGTEEGRRALLEGAELAKRFQAQTHLLAVITGKTGAAMAQGLAAAAPMEQTVYFQNTIGEGVRFFKKHGLQAQGHAVHGEPVEEIVKLAKQIGADLVVVGHRERGALARWWSTPTSMSLLEKLGCSVLIGRKETDTSVLPDTDR
jgi:nucleotide-binding universal stress UspA family protein